ncbi:MAG TPA: TonB-dependent receptor, partial [Rhodothermales bacterium]|nr:TonB-dependent receptor [Rhodothermales bacterium]
ALRAADVDGIPNLFYFYDVNAKVNLDASRDDRFSVSVYTGKDRLDVPFLEDAQVSVAVGNRTFSTNWTHIFSDKVFSNFTLTGSQYFSLPNFYVGGTAFHRDNQVYDVSAKGEFEYIPNERHEVRAGFWTGNFTMRLQDVFDEQAGLHTRIASPYTSVYLEDTYRPTPLVMLRGGVRASYFQRGNYLRLAPRLTAEYRPTADVRLQAGYGRYYQFFTLITSQLLSAFDIWLTTGEGVNPSYGDQFIVGVKTRLADNLHLDVESYYRTMEQLFELDPFLPDVAGLDYDQLFHVGSGEAFGLEVQLERTRGRLNGFIGYTLGRTLRRYEDLNEGHYFPPKYDRTHDVTAVVNFGLGRNWKATGVWTYATGQTYTQPTGVYQTQGDPVMGGTRTVYDINGFNNRRLPPYHRLDLGVAKTGRFFGIADYELQFQVVNAYDRRNIWFYYFEIEDDNTIKRTEVPQIPVPIPNLSFSLTF